MGELNAGTFDVLVKDSKGDPVSDAVVFAEPRTVAGGDPASTAGGPPRTVTIAQQGLEFDPYVTAVTVGTEVRFPNRDPVLHNVYSFSKAKVFQLPLYKDEPPAPVLFDKPGAVTLGCNIHDWMVAYVYVLKTPYYAKTNKAGRAAIAGVPAGEYDLGVWHPRNRRRGSSPSRRLRIGEDEAIRTELVIRLKPEWRPRRATGAD